MEIKILQVFLGADGLPYKDQERTVHFPIIGSGFQGASNTTKIRFYYDELVEQDDTETSWVACAKLPNGKIGSKVLETDYDETLGEHYALLELDSFYFQYKGDVYISLQGYQGGVQVDYDEETELYTIYGTPTIAATGSIKLSVNYAPQFVGSGETSNVNFQRILADLGTKLGIRATSVYVEELPTVGNPDTFYVIKNDLSDPNKANIYIWNSLTEHYVWVGDNTLDLGDYYTTEQGEQFEDEIDQRVTSVENELESVNSGGPKGVYATTDALATADPDHSYTYLVLADNKWYYWNGTAWAAGGTYLQASFDDFLDSASSNAVKNSALYPLMAKTYGDLVLTPGKYVGGNGSLYNLDQCSYSNFIDIKDVNYIYAYFLANTSIAYYYNNDENSFISVYTFSSNYQGWFKITPPENCKYIRFSNRNTYLADSSVKVISIISLQNERKIEDLNGQIGTFSTSDLSWTTGKYIGENGAINTFVSYSYCDYVLATGAIAVYCALGGSASIAYYDEDKTFISSQTGSSSPSLKQLTVPNNAKYIRISNGTNALANANVYVVYDISSYLVSMEADIENLKNKTLDDFRVTETPNMIDGGYIANWNGTVAVLSGFSYSDYIECSSVYSVYTSIVDSAVIAYYDENKIYISNVTAPNSNPREYVLTKPNNAKYIRISNYQGKLDDEDVKVNYLPNEIIIQNKNEIEEVKSEIAGTTNVFNTLTMFEKIMCCGDSITYGQVYTGESTSRLAYQSYPQVLEKLVGVTVAKYAVAGYTATNWWNAYANNINENGLYIIFLGTNEGLTDTIDTDCVGTDYTQFANTNTGNYGKILQKIADNNYNAILVKCYASSGNKTTTNEVIDKFALRYNLPVIDLEDDNRLNANYHYFPDKSGQNTVHFNDLGYCWLANLIKKRIDELSPEDKFKIMRKQ